MFLAKVLFVLASLSIIDAFMIQTCKTRECEDFAVIVAIDTAEGIYRKEFDQVKRFVKRLSSLYLGPGRNIGVINYATEAEVSIGHSTFNKPKEFNKEVDKLKRKGGVTNTTAALEGIGLQCEKVRRANRNYACVGIIVTHGISFDEETRAAANETRSHGTLLVVVALADAVNQPAVKEVASTHDTGDETSFRVKEYGDLHCSARNVLGSVCTLSEECITRAGQCIRPSNCLVSIYRVVRGKCPTVNQEQLSCCQPLKMPAYYRGRR